MATAFGVDTLTSRLDLITWTDFSTWNGGTTAAFAGRPFLGDRFLWGRGEATDSRTNPHPEDPSLLNLVGPELIAPIQSANKTRQQLTGMRGFLAGAIDGQALCRRVVSGVLSGEFSMPLGGSVNLWLTVDPTVDFASDYWSGWADAVNGFPATSVPHLFAKNPVANAAQLLTDLATFFPAAQGRYVFGPLLQIGWGSLVSPAALHSPDGTRRVLGARSHLRRA